MFKERAKLVIFLVYLSAEVSAQSCSVNEKEPRIVFYYGPTFESHESYGLGELENLLRHPKFIHEQTNVCMHGYSLSQEAPSVRLMVDSYLKRNTINLLTVDWTELAGGSYVSAQENVIGLAPRVARSILRLIKAGLEEDSLSLVGHSLGALAVGMIAREVRKQSNGSVLLPRVTALDPSNPEAHEVFLLPPVEPSDARFVDVIHTDAGGRGTQQRMGHADFWPNGGKAIQPGCPPSDVNYKCSHQKAWTYWAESVANVNPQLYQAKHANDSSTSSVAMGIDCPPSARGDYFLTINSEYGAVPGIGLGS